MNVTRILSTVAHAAIYVFGDCAPRDVGAVKAQAEESFAAAIAVHSEVSTPWPFGDDGPLYGRFFLLPDKISYVGVAERGAKFIKVRLTFVDGEEILRKMVGGCLGEIVAACRGMTGSWELAPQLG